MGKQQKNASSSTKKKGKRSAPAKVKKARIEFKEAQVSAVSEIVEMGVEERCDLIAELSESVMIDPTTAFTTAKGDEGGGGGGGEEDDARETSKMRRLLELANELKNGHDQFTARLAILSLLALFQDILPSYRIRLPTQAEMSVRVAKETKKLWDYERALLTHYQQYLKLLERTWERGKGLGSKDDPPSALAVTSVLALCELLKAAPHFNFRSNILNVVVRQMNNKQCEEVSSACCLAVGHVFKTDAQGEVALEAARLVAKMVKDRGFRVRAGVLRSFLSLPLRVHVDEAQAAKIAAAANAKKRKKDKEGAEIENEMREGSSSVDKILLARSQADTLEAVTLTYFRILKSEDLTAEHIAELLPPALEGLAKFAHLINMDTVVDLLGVLKSLLKKVDALPLDASLNCVLTAFQTLQGPGKEMQIDQKEYVTPLYSQLPRLATENSSRQHTEIALKCLDAAFIKRREYSTVRIAAFVKQLCTVSLHAPAHTSGPLMAFVRQLLQRYTSVHQMLENEQDVITSGTYAPGLDDPEQTNPFATSAWELATLKFHYKDQVAAHASGAASLRILQFPAEAPDRVRKNMIRDADEMYIECKRLKKKHPLESRGGDRRQQARFITPRKTGNYHLK